jgi:CSLREA domain-containing protein
MTTPWERRRLHPQAPGARERRLVLAALAAVFVVFALIMSAVGAGAAPVFKVDTTTDAVDATPGDGKCESASGSCTLRAAIQEAGVSGGDITLPAGTYKLTVYGSWELGPQYLSKADSSQGDFDIFKAISVKGEGPGKTVIDGVGAVRIFDVHAKDPNVATSEVGVLKLEGVRLTRGKGDYDSASGHFHGGAIHNHGQIELSHVVVDSSVSPPIASTPSPWGGGGITNATGAKAQLDEVTVARNSSEFHGGGIENFGQLNMSHVTLAQNTAPAGKGGGLWMGGNQQVVLPSYTLIAQNTGGDCAQEGGRIIQVYNNLQGDGTCDFAAATDKKGDPKFESGVSGAPVYYALSPSSPATDADTERTCEGTDVRGVDRGQDGDGDGKAGCDIGSYERKATGGDKAVTVSVGNAKVTELGAATVAQRRPRIGILSFAVKLSRASKQVVTVRAATADRTARAGLDYVKKFAKLRFRPGQTKKSFVVPVLADRRPEGTETLRVRLSKATNAKLGRAVGIGRILNP